MKVVKVSPFFFQGKDERAETVYQLLQFTYQYGWSRLKRLEGLGKTTYNEILNALYNANFIVFSEDRSIILSPEIAAFVL